MGSAPLFTTKVSVYDRVASMLIALLILIGFFVMLMFLVWLTKRVMATQRAVPVKYIEELAGRGDHAMGTARDLEPPGVEELADVVEPQLTETLEAVTDVVSTQLAALDALEGHADAVGTGGGQGDSRRAGPLGEGAEDIVPRWERWEIQFSATNQKSYAEQLDFFKIELGAIGGGNPNVDYVAKLSQAQPVKRSAPSAQEQRLYMTWTSGVLQDADRQVLAKSGVETRGRVIMQFYPQEVEDLLAGLENERAGRRTLQEILRTLFGVRGGGGGYEFYVIDQQYRSVAP